MHTVATFFKQMCSKFDGKKKNLFPLKLGHLVHLNNIEQQQSLWTF